MLKRNKESPILRPFDYPKYKQYHYVRQSCENDTIRGYENSINSSLSPQQKIFKAEFANGVLSIWDIEPQYNLFRGTSTPRPSRHFVEYRLSQRYEVIYDKNRRSSLWDFMEKECIAPLDPSNFTCLGSRLASPPLSLDKPEGVLESKDIYGE